MRPVNRKPVLNEVRQPPDNFFWRAPWPTRIVSGRLTVVIFSATGGRRYNRIEMPKQ